MFKTLIQKIIKWFGIKTDPPPEKPKGHMPVAPGSGLWKTFKQTMKNAKIENDLG